VIYYLVLVLVGTQFHLLEQSVGIVARINFVGLISREHLAVEGLKIPDGDVGVVLAVLFPLEVAEKRLYAGPLQFLVGAVKVLRLQFG
jgi:hypothetical protein